MQQSPPRKKRPRKRKGALPKGAYRLPDGGYIVPPKPSSQEKPIKVPVGGEKLRIVPVYRDQPDARAIARVLLVLAGELPGSKLNDEYDIKPPDHKKSA